MSLRLPMSTVYRALAFVAFVVTWTFNVRYILGGGGLGPSEFFGAAFANDLTQAITLDVYLAALAFAIWVMREARSGIAVRRPWLYVALCFGIGLAIALPLYLAAREDHLKAGRRAGEPEHPV
jgi:Terpene cyclase DEP1